MKKRIFKQGMALMLAAALALPANVVPAEILDQQTETELPHIVLNQETPDEKVTDSDAKEKEEQTGTQTETKTKTKTEVNATETAEQIIYNTGSFNVHVVSEEDFENDLGDAYFEEDGSYTINIPEENPFFPYEVQFTYDGKTENEWFMNPEDSIEIDGHTFYVSASFDGTAVTQLTMEVAGQEVVVYPKEKAFTDGDGVALMSLLPLEERNLSLDLSGFTPIELACVKPATVFKGENQIGTETEILWKPRDSRDNYESDPDSVGVVAMDLAFNTSGATSTSWEMIVGNPDQLDASNIRYYVDIAVTDTENWLIPTVTIHNDEGTTKNVTVTDAYYSEHTFYSRNRRMYVDVPTEEVKGNPEMTVSLKINSDLFERSVISKIDTHYLSNEVPYEAVKKDDGCWYIEVTGKRDRLHNVGFLMNGYDKNDQVLGDAIDFSLYLSAESDHVYTNLYDKTGNNISYSTSWEEDEEDPWMEEKLIYNLGASNKDNDTYRLVLTFEKAVATSENQIIGAFIGRYESLDAAKAAGAVDVKESLFNQTQGYEADFSKGVYVSVFSGKADDDSRKLKRYVWHIYTRSEAFLDNSTAVSFYGINDAQGNYVACKVLNPSYGDYKDDYADFSYITILVGEDTDLTSLAPVFTMQNGMKLYTNKEEISGQSLHDFSNGPVHYTASAENSKNAKNYWLQIIKPKQGESWLYMNSLADESSDTREENGVVYTTREAMLNSIHDYEHRIILANMGTKALSKLSVEAEGALFDSWVVTLDNYWPLKGAHDLSGYQGLGYDELANLAKLKLVYDGDEINGQDLTGTLTIKEAGKPIMVINLTGVVGDPGIVTTEIPDAVKYVHYGSMIQNSNKYDFNTVSYKITDGKLPSGMELKPNGELYGVPLETGEFTFTVQMKNSYSEFANVTKEFTLKVVDNTDANVDSAVDQGYDLKERVPNILLSDNNDYTMTSVGVIEEWDNLTLDGKRLVEGVDFDAKSGSTRLTIRSQTLKANNQVGTHTLSAEFREKGTGTLKRAAQNYKVTKNTTSGGSSGGHSSSGGSGRATVKADIKTAGADGAWFQDANGWKCKAADGTWYTNCWKELTYQNEKSWYRFDAQGYLVTGWYLDNGEWYYMNPNSDGKLGKMMTGWQYINNIWYYLNEKTDGRQGAMYHNTWAQLPYNGTVEWYYFDENGTMMTEWLTQAENKYYLYPIADGTRGRMLTGWQKIGDNWYYFHEESDGNKGVMARRTKIGKYYVNTDGVWAK